MESKADLAEIARLHHVHSYALAKALTEVIGGGRLFWLETMLKPSSV